MEPSAPGYPCAVRPMNDELHRDSLSEPSEKLMFFICPSYDLFCDLITVTLHACPAGNNDPSTNTRAALNGRPHEAWPPTGPCAHLSPGQNDDRVLDARRHTVTETDIHRSLLFARHSEFKICFFPHRDYLCLIIKINLGIFTYCLMYPVFLHRTRPRGRTFLQQPPTLITRWLVARSLPASYSVQLSQTIVTFTFNSTSYPARRSAWAGPLSGSVMYNSVDADKYVVDLGAWLGLRSPSRPPHRGPRSPLSFIISITARYALFYPGKPP